MLLLNDEGIEQTLLLEDFDVPADASRDYQVEDDWAADLERGSYGLAVVFPGRSIHNLTIWFGEETEDPVPTWPAIQDCEE